MKAMILAAGLGTRLRPLTLTTPKPLIPVNGRPLIEHHILALAQAGVKDILINVSWLANDIIRYLGDGRQLGVNITYSKEDAPLETAGGIVKALPFLCSETTPRCIVVNGDIRTDFSFGDWLSRLDHGLSAASLAHLVLTDNPAFHPDGDFSFDTGIEPLLRDTSYPLTDDTAHPKFTFSGISLLHRDLFASLSTQPAQPAALAPLLRQAISSRQASGELMSAQWIDIGTAERLASAEKRFTRN
jgi:MurNAc alpha-1-phosphate uridylyltransferase